MSDEPIYVDPVTADVVPGPVEVKVTDNRHSTIAERAAAAREAAREARERVAKHRPKPKPPETPEKPAEPTMYFRATIFMVNGEVLKPKDPLPDTEAGIFRELMKLEEENPDARTFQLTLDDGTIYFGRSKNIDHFKLEVIDTGVQTEATQVE